MRVHQLVLQDDFQSPFLVYYTVPGRRWLEIVAGHRISPHERIYTADYPFCVGQITVHQPLLMAGRPFTILPNPHFGRSPQLAPMLGDVKCEYLSQSQGG